MAGKSVAVDSREALDEAHTQLTTARAVLDLVYCGAAVKDGAYVSSLDDGTIAGAMHDAIERINAALELIDKVGTGLAEKVRAAA